MPVSKQIGKVHMSNKKVRSVRVKRSLDRLNLTELIREIECLAERLIYADVFKKSGDLQQYELVINNAKNSIALSIMMMTEHALFHYQSNKSISDS